MLLCKPWGLAATGAISHPLSSSQPSGHHELKIHKAQRATGIAGPYPRQVSTAVNLLRTLQTSATAGMQNIWETSGFSVSLGTVILAFHGGRGLWKPPEVVSLQHPPSWKHSQSQERADSNTSFRGQGLRVLQPRKYPNTEVLNQTGVQSSPQIDFSLRSYQRAAGHGRSNRAALCTDLGAGGSALTSQSKFIIQYQD